VRIGPAEERPVRAEMRVPSAENYEVENPDLTFDGDPNALPVHS